MASCNQSTRNTSNIVQTQINRAQISNRDNGLVKSTDKPYASVGETMTYTIVLKNTGNTAADNIVFIDTIPTGLIFVANSVMLNGTTIPGISPEPPGGVTIATLLPGKVATINFQTTVSTLPVVSQASNVGEVSYNYTVDPSLPDGSNANNPTNVVTSTIANASLDLGKLTDTIYAKINDIITYTITLANSGNTVLNNVIFQDTIPNDSTFEVGSVIVDGVAKSGNPQNGINIGSLGIGSNSTITFKVKVATIPSPNPMENKANILYKFTINPNDPNGASGRKTTNIVQTTVSDVLMQSKKFVDPIYVILGETTVYTLVFKNNGNTDANNVVVIDTIPNGLVFVPASVLINGNPDFISDPNTGIDIGTVPANTTTTVTFIVTADTVPSINPTSNIANIGFNYTVDPSIPNGESGGNPTNSIDTTIINASQETEKYRDKEYVSLNDVISYTLRIANTGNIILNNLIVYDTVPYGTTLVPGSIIVNGSPVLGGNLQTGLSIGNLSVGDTTTVNFRLTVTTLPSPNTLDNSFDTAYNFTLTPSIPNGESRRDTSNITTSTVNDAIIGKGPNGFPKTPDKPYADVGDVITYTISLANTGNVPGNSIIIKDTIPKGTSFIEDSVTIGGATVPGANPQSGIDLGILNPGNYVTVTFGILVETVPNPNPIPNQASISYTYTKDPSLPDGEQAKGTSTLTTVPVNHGDIPSGSPDGTTGFIKSGSTKFAKPGDTITYTFTIPNTGNVPVNNVIFRDTIPVGTIFVNNSVVLNNSALIGVNPENGITIGTINPGNKAVLAYKVTVESQPSVSTADNKGFVTYNYIVDPSKPPVDKASESNLVTIPIGSANVIIINSVDKEVAQIGDILTYTLDVNNIGNLEALNLLVKNMIPEGTEFVPGSVTLDGVTLPNANPETTGISFSQLAAGGSTQITFKVVVKKIPPNGQIMNVAEVKYEYISNPAEPPVSSGSVSNEVITKPRSVDFNGDNFKKTSNPEFAAINDIVTFDFVIKNNGNIEALNTIFTDAIPEGTEFVTDSVVIDGEPQIGANPEIGVDLGTIIAGEEIHLSFSVKVLRIPTINPIPNKGTLNYESIVQEEEPPVPGSNDSNETTTQINSPDIVITKNPSITSAAVDDIISYTINIENKGNVPADNFVLYDQLQAEVEFVPGSVTINGKIQPLENIISGINLGSVPPNKPIVITFEVKIAEEPKDGIVTNVVTSSYDFTVNPNEPPRQGNTDSNISKIEVGVAELTLTKKADKEVVILGDIVTYTVEAKNTGTLDLTNITIYDKLPKQLEFIENSIVLNGKKINSVDIVTGVNIGTLKPGDKATIEYKTKYIDNCYACEVVNMAYATFDFTTSGKCNEKTRTTDPVSCSIKASSPTFKEITQDSILVIPPPKLEIEEVSDLTANVCILDYHVIKTIVGVSDENKRLTGYKLIINGAIEQTLEYTACEELQSVHSADFRRKFSTFIILPEKFDQGSNLSISAIVEDIYYNQLNEREVFTNATILLEVKILC